VKLTKAFFNDIRELIRSARGTVAHGVDVVQVHTNFEIGRRIFEQEQKGKDRAAYGKEVLKALAEQLTGEFGKGFSQTNLKLMRQFYHQNQRRISQSLTDQSKIFQAATGKSVIPKRFTLSWTHYVFLLGIKNPEECSFYEIEATQQNWTVRELKRQFDASLYERLALSRDKEGGTLHDRYRAVLKEDGSPRGDHSPQRCQHPRQGISTLPAQQRRVAAEARGVGRRVGSEP